MGKLSQKIYPLEELKERVTIRVLPSKMQVYPRFKELVTEQLGSDVCFVTTSLWEAFLNAMDQLPPAGDPIEMKFMRQNVQVNIGCNINYEPKRARRYPQPSPPWEFKSKNHFLPLLLDEWETMGERQKEFWIKRLQEKGIMPKIRKRKPRSDKGIPRKRAPPSLSTGDLLGLLGKKIFKTLIQSMTIVTDWLKRLLRRKKPAAHETH